MSEMFLQAESIVPPHHFPWDARRGSILQPSQLPVCLPAGAHGPVLRLQSQRRCQTKAPQAPLLSHSCLSLLLSRTPVISRATARTQDHLHSLHSSSCVHLCWGEACATVHMWKSEDSLSAYAVPFHHVCPGDWTQVVRLGDRGLSAESSISPAPRFPVWKPAELGI